MSAFIESTPTLEVTLENPLLGRRYPTEGTAVAVVDTGFGGFLAVPEEVFNVLGLGEQEPLRRTVVLADASRTSSRGTFARLSIGQARASVEGRFETWRGLDEILIGSEALEPFRLDLDYCLRRMTIVTCGMPRPPEPRRP